MTDHRQLDADRPAWESGEGARDPAMQQELEAILPQGPYRMKLKLMGQVGLALFGVAAVCVLAALNIGFDDSLVTLAWGVAGGSAIAGSALLYKGTRGWPGRQLRIARHPRATVVTIRGTRAEDIEVYEPGLLAVHYAHTEWVTYFYQAPEGEQVYEIMLPNARSPIFLGRGETDALGVYDPDNPEYAVLLCDGLNQTFAFNWLERRAILRKADEFQNAVLEKIARGEEP